MKRPIRELRRRVFSRCFIDSSNAVSDSLLLAGSGRSGTTWVAEFMNFRNRRRVLFEPFHSRVISGLGLSCYADRFRDLDEADPAFEQFATGVFSGQLRHGTVDSHNRCFYCRGRLVKDVCCNLSMPWLQRRFPEVPMILLLRHPFAVAHSKMTLGWNDHLAHYLEQNPLRERISADVWALCSQARSGLERHVACWCLENYIPLQFMSPSTLDVVFYEACLDPTDHEVHRVMALAGEPWAPALQRFMKKPSLTARARGQHVANVSLMDLLWQYADAEALDRAWAMVECFGLDRLYARGGEIKAGAKTGFVSFEKVDHRPQTTDHRPACP